MRKRLIVLGSSGLAREMAMLADAVNEVEGRWEFKGYIGESASETGTKVGRSATLGDDDWLLSQDFEADLLIGIGYAKVRAKVLQRYLEAGARFGFPTFIHPTAVVKPNLVKLGKGNAITQERN